MSEAEAAPEESSAPDPQDERPSTQLVERPRLARWVAVAGILGAIVAARFLVIPKIPEDHDVEVKLPTPADVVGLDLRWIAPETGDDVLTTSLRFAAGTAPASVRTNVHLPNGPYEVTIAVARVSGVDSSRRRITLDDSARVTIPLR